MQFSSILLCAGLLSAQTQLAAQDKCRVEGKVLNSATAQTLPRTSVTLQASSSALTTITDGEGNFVFTGLAAGRYSITAKRDNFQSDSNSWTLTPGEEKKDVVLRLIPYGAIAGHVRDEAGDAASNLQVSAMVYAYSPGGRQLRTRSTATTNDLGEYRLFGLLAGKYFLKTAQRQAFSVDQIYPAIYYPNATDPSSAAPLDLGAGQELLGNDFTIRLTHAESVRGRVVRPAGSTQTSVSLTASGMPTTNVAVSEPQGTFELHGVAPGAYTLAADARVGEKLYSVRRPIQVVAGDIEGIELRLVPPVDLNGVVRIEGNSGIKLSQLRIGTEWATRVAVKDDGTFALHDLMAVINHPTIERPDALFVKSMRCGNTDVIESGVDLTGGGCELVVTLSANSGQIEGNVVDEDEQPAKAASVTLLPQGTKRTDLARFATTDASGHFKIVGVAPGSYRLYAWEHVDDLNAVWYDPDFVKPFETLGRSLQIAEGGRETVSLKRIAKPAGQ